MIGDNNEKLVQKVDVDPCAGDVCEHHRDICCRGRKNPARQDRRTGADTIFRISVILVVTLKATSAAYYASA